MKRTSVFLICLSLISCGGDDDLLTAEEAKERFGCTIKEGAPGSGEYTIVCPDGSTATIGQGRDGLAGDSCTVEDKGDGTHLLSCTDGTATTIKDGQSARVIETQVPPGEVCPQGGKLLEFYVGDESEPKTTLTECEGGEPRGCTAGFILDPELNACVSFAAINFEGKLINAQEVDKLPAALRPTQTLVTIDEDANNASTCKGSLTYPTGLVPLEGYGGLSEKVTYLFGNVQSYQMDLEIGGVTWRRNSVTKLPNHLSMTRGLEVEFDQNGLPVSGFGVEAKATSIDSLERGENATHELFLKGRVFSAQAKAQLKASLPLGTSDWVPLLADDQVTMGLNVSDFGTGQATSVICKVERFFEMTP